MLKHFRKTRDKLNHFMNTYIASLPFRQYWFHMFALAQTFSRSTLNLQAFQQYYDRNVGWPSLCQSGHIKMSVYRNNDELQQ